MTQHFRGSVVTFALIASALVGTIGNSLATSDGDIEIHVPIHANSCKAVMFGVGGSLADYLLEIKATNSSCPPSSLRIYVYEEEVQHSAYKHIDRAQLTQNCEPFSAPQQGILKDASAFVVFSIHSLCSTTVSLLFQKDPHSTAWTKQRRSLADSPQAQPAVLPPSNSTSLDLRDPASPDNSAVDPASPDTSAVIVPIIVDPASSVEELEISNSNRAGRNADTGRQSQPDLDVAQMLSGGQVRVQCCCMRSKGYPVQVQVASNTVVLCCCLDSNPCCMGSPPCCLDIRPVQQRPPASFCDMKHCTAIILGTVLAVVMVLGFFIIFVCRMRMRPELEPHPGPVTCWLFLLFSMLRRADRASPSTGTGVCGSSPPPLPQATEGLPECLVRKATSAWGCCYTLCSTVCCTVQVQLL
eukprot:jgi/Botrbrau1/16106/Bobra.7_2s0070.2